MRYSIAAIISITIIGAGIGGFTYFQNIEGVHLLSESENVNQKKVVNCNVEGPCEESILNKTYTIDKGLHNVNGTQFIGGCSVNGYYASPHLCRNTTAERVDEITMVADGSNHINDPITSEDFKDNLVYEASNIVQMWDMVFLSEEKFLTTLQSGKIIELSPDNSGKNTRIVKNISVHEEINSGLLGISKHPDFTEKPYIYVYYSYIDEGNMFENILGDTVWNRVSRFRWENGSLGKEEIILDKIQGNIDHSGGRIEFGPDKKLYIATGDARHPLMASNTSFLGGKVLRINADGSIPVDNPFNGSPVYSKGHRNPQGLGWKPQNDQLYATEHGAKRHDELNRIDPGKDYGWPEKWCEVSPSKAWYDKFGIPPEELDVKGDQEPVHCWKDYTIGPSGITFMRDQKSPWFGDLFVSGLRGRHLHRFDFESGEIKTNEVFFRTNSGSRIRNVEEYKGDLFVQSTQKIYRVSSEK